MPPAVFFAIVETHCSTPERTDGASYALARVDPFPVEVCERGFVFCGRVATALPGCTSRMKQEYQADTWRIRASAEFAFIIA
jgi:hypothetical protein